MENIILPTILIDEEYFKAYSQVPNAFNWDDIRPIIPIAEAIHIAPILGQPLYDDVKREIENEDISDVYSALLLEVYKLLAPSIVYEALPFLAYHISEKGITKGKSENSDAIDTTEYTNLAMHLQQQLPTLKTILHDFLERHKECYPLYKSDECECGEKNNNGGCIYNSNRKNFGIR